MYAEDDGFAPSKDADDDETPKFALLSFGRKMIQREVQMRRRMKELNRTRARAVDNHRNRATRKLETHDRQVTGYIDDELLQVRSLILWVVIGWQCDCLVP